MTKRTMMGKWPVNLLGLISAIEMVAKVKVTSYAIVGQQFTLVIEEIEPETESAEYARICGNCGFDGFDDDGYCKECGYFN